MATLYLSNRTNVSTPKLAQHALVGRSLQVGELLVPPGGVAPIEEGKWVTLRPFYKRLIQMGAITVSAENPAATKPLLTPTPPASPPAPPPPAAAPPVTPPVVPAPPVPTPPVPTPPATPPVVTPPVVTPPAGK